MLCVYVCACYIWSKSQWRGPTAKRRRSGDVATSQRHRQKFVRRPDSPRSATVRFPPSVTTNLAVAVVAVREKNLFPEMVEQLKMARGLTRKRRDFAIANLIVVFSRTPSILKPSVSASP